MSRDIRCQIVSWRQVHRLSRDLAFRIRDDGFKSDIIVAVGRGGWIPGRLLSDYLGNLNLTDIKVEHYKGTQKHRRARVRYPLRASVDGQRVLVVDDVTDTGDSLDAAIDHIRSAGNPIEIRTAVLHHKAVSRCVPDYFAVKVETWRWIIYPWAMVEDLTGLVGALEGRPAEALAVAERLRQTHGIRVDPSVVRDVLALMGGDQSGAV
ncbi:MAG: phosphoribosyltransferase [Chromatiaceae bacterium]